jgi:phage FluMu protein Com
MSLTSFVDENCPRCHKPIKQTGIEPHPSRSDLAIQNFECADCGPVKAKIYSLQPDKAVA